MRRQRLQLHVRLILVLLHRPRDDLDATPLPHRDLVRVQRLDVRLDAIQRVLGQVQTYLPNGLRYEMCHILDTLRTLWSVWKRILGRMLLQ